MVTRAKNLTTAGVAAGLVLTLATLVWTKTDRTRADEKRISAIEAQVAECRTLIKTSREDENQRMARMESDIVGINADLGGLRGDMKDLMYYLMKGKR